MTANLIVGIILIVLGIGLLIPAIMATAGKLPGNNVIGLRIPEVRKDKSTWNQAHKVVGPFWLFSAVALLFGAAFAFIASGWVWIAPALAVILAIVFLSVGGNFGARAAILIDKARSAAENQPEQQEPAPQVDLGALRKAASKADDNDQSSEK
ncbi:SdpI family protein [Corynebacterium breve]|uniref:SdpI family protein n=1 Tax=Corynebacterium breve TaxID=3049799 RepID=A0ABY8VDT3_9CORY|nr:SdpI family protein [Corynebacterium breve]WIM67663.1 SdpI family protein [Corynebacterium breve]